MPLDPCPEGNHDSQLLLFVVVVHEPPGWHGDWIHGASGAGIGQVSGEKESTKGGALRFESFASAHDSLQRKTTNAASSVNLKPCSE